MKICNKNMKSKLMYLQALWNISLLYNKKVMPYFNNTITDCLTLLLDVKPFLVHYFLLFK